MASFLEVLHERGYQFRQHLPEVSWADRKLTVIDLNEAQQAVLQNGDGDIAGLKKHMDAQGQWSFPAMDVTCPLPRSADVSVAVAGKTHACIVAPNTTQWQTFAGKLADELAKHGGQRVSIVSDATDLETILTDGPAIVLGGADENQAAAQMALRYRTCFVDASVPGVGGWLVTTHAGLNTAGHNVLQISASPEHHATTLAYVENHIEHAGDNITIRHMHHVVSGPALKARFPTWEQFATRLPSSILQFAGIKVEPEMDPVALSHLLAKGLDCGGPTVSIYNAEPIDLIIIAARYYQISADQQQKPRSLSVRGFVVNRSERQ